MNLPHVIVEETLKEHSGASLSLMKLLKAWGRIDLRGRARRFIFCSLFFFLFSNLFCIDHMMWYSFVFPVWSSGARGKCDVMMRVTGGLLMG